LAKQGVNPIERRRAERFEPSKHVRSLTQEELLSLLNYEPTTGMFTWKPRPNLPSFKRINEPAGFRKDNYIVIKIGNKSYPAHRLAWLYMTGELPPASMLIDHKNGKRDDNRWDNLRLATPVQNSMNRAVPRNNTSGHIGVTREFKTGEERWRAKINFNGLRRDLGHYATIDEAIAARRAAEAKLHGEWGGHVR
jgi:hypothetical protein